MRSGRERQTNHTQKKSPHHTVTSLTRQRAVRQSIKRSPLCLTNTSRSTNLPSAYKNGGRIDADVAVAALTLHEVDEFGLDRMDGQVLRTLIEKFNGGPVGLNSLAVAMGEDATTLEEVYEPFLIMEGFLQRTPQGRVATPRAYRHFGYVLPESDTPAPPQGSLFANEG